MEQNNDPLEQLEACQKQLEDYALQLEAINNSEDLSDEETQSRMDYLMRTIEEATEELEALIQKL